MYAKIIDGVLYRAPNKVTYQKKIIFNPSTDILITMGYFPVVSVDMPTDAPDGQYYKSSWVQNETEIVQVWELVEAPTYEVEPTMSDLMAAVERGISS